MTLFWSKKEDEALFWLNQQEDDALFWRNQQEEIFCYECPEVIGTNRKCEACCEWNQDSGGIVITEETSQGGGDEDAK